MEGNKSPPSSDSKPVDEPQTGSGDSKRINKPDTDSADSKQIGKRETGSADANQIDEPEPDSVESDEPQTDEPEVDKSMLVEWERPVFTPEDIRKALADLEKPLTPTEHEIIEISNINSLDDPLGDGDQSPIPDPTTPEFIAAMERDIEAASKDNLEASMHLRLAARKGLDRMNPYNLQSEPGYLPFYKFCEMGAYGPVYNAIGLTYGRAVEFPGELRELIDRRISLMRWTPLHYCCYGATVYTKLVALTPTPIPDDVFRYKDVVKQLCRAGAKVDAKDIAGHTPLAIAAGENASKESLELVQLLVNLGADINIKNRFGDPIMVEPTVTQNGPAFEAMLAAGGNGRAEDNVGMPVYAKALGTEKMGRIWVNHVRDAVLENEECGYCSKSGASKFCSKCRKVYYCNRGCQVKAWKSGHKKKCGKEKRGEYVDLVIETMCFRKDEPDVQAYVKKLDMDINRVFKPIQEKELGVPFRVFVFLHEDPKGNRECHLISIAAKHGHSYWIKRIGPGRAVSDLFIDLVMSKADPGLGRTLFYLAKFVKPVQVIRNGQKITSSVLRIDISRVLPPLKPVDASDEASDRDAEVLSGANLAV